MLFIETVADLTVKCCPFVEEPYPPKERRVDSGSDSSKRF